MADAHDEDSTFDIEAYRARKNAITETFKARMRAEEEKRMKRKAENTSPLDNPVKKEPREEPLFVQDNRETQSGNASVSVLTGVKQDETTADAASSHPRASPSSPTISAKPVKSDVSANASDISSKPLTPSATPASGKQDTKPTVAKAATAAPVAGTGPPVSAFSDGRRASTNVKPFKIPKSLQRSQDSTENSATSVSTNPAAGHGPGTDISASRMNLKTDRVGASSTPAKIDREWGMANITWLQPTARSRKHNSSQLHELKQIREVINKCKNPNKVNQLDELHDKLREWLHKYRHFEVTAEMMQASKILEPDCGLPYLFQSHQQFPFDIRADSKELALKWRRQDFDPDILRYLIFNGKKRPRLDPERPLPLRADSAGEGDLVNGQWFPNWLCAVRDGAHGSTQAGIYGKRGMGAFSVVMAGAYADIDEGNRVEYCSVNKAEGAANDANSTQLLLENNGRPGRPVRLLRSENLKKHSQYAPELGLRYDGLYKVVDYKTINEQKGEYQFIMERLPNQDPIRWEGLMKRPTDEEVNVYNRHKQKLKGVDVW